MWKADNHGDDTAHKKMMDAARALDADSAIDGLTVTQLRARAMAIAKQITQLVGFLCSVLVNMLTLTCRARLTITLRTFLLLAL